jgi:hypothetical protein
MPALYAPDERVLTEGCPNLAGTIAPAAMAAVPTVAAKPELATAP